MMNDRLSQGGFPLNFFLLTFIFSWFFWMFGILSSLEIITFPFPNMGWVVIGAHGPLFASLLLTYRAGGWTAVKDLIRAGFRLRMKLVWWIGILVLPFILAAVAVWINVSLSDFELDITLLSQPLLILPTFLFLFFLGGSVQEEFGWRGYALPRLLAAWNPLVSSLILGAIWGLWHLPLFYIVGTSQVYMPFGVFFLLAISFSILFTWFYLKTARSLFSALLFHTAINASLSVFPPIEQQAGGNQLAFTYMTAAYYLVAVILILTGRSFWFRRLEN